MRTQPLRLLIALCVFFATAAWAQESGGPIGTMSWEDGYPKGNGTINAKGSYSFPSGWSYSGTITAFLPSGATDEYVGYGGTLGFFSGTWSGAVSSYLPPGDYTVLAEATLVDGSGATEIVMADIATANNQGTAPKSDPGTVKITTGPTGKNLKIEASGTFQTNKGWSIKLGSFKALALPTNALGQLDKGRKAASGVPVPNVQGTWSLSLPNLQPGIYQLWVGADFTEIVNPDKVVKAWSAKYVTVSE